MRLLVLKITLLFLFLFLLSSVAMAQRDFQKIQVPGAQCGDGTPYHIYVSKRSDKKVVFEMQDGGACWDYSSCEGKIFTKLYNRGIKKKDVIGSDDEKESPFKEYSMVFLPYCTGDVFAGDHVAIYNKKISPIKHEKIRVYHTGYSNVTKVLQYLDELELIKFSEIEKFVLDGSSAGAVGAIVNAKQFEEYLPIDAAKYLVADAPGLHWGTRFWNKFSDEMLNDFSTSFGKINAEIYPENGSVIKNLPDIAESLSQWEIAIMQGSKDIAMSWIFGNTTMHEHKKQVYGPEGVVQLCDKIPNCKSWVPDTAMHTFVRKQGITSNYYKFRGQNGIQFLKGAVDE